jgi:membrane-associated phospholipid phosphatase
MSAVNGLHHDADGAAPLSAWRRCAANVLTALTILGRPARIHPRAPWISSRQLAIAAAVFVAVFVIGIVFIDAPATNAVMRLPRWLISFFDAITEYGKSGYFLWPLGILFLFLAAMPPVAPRFAQLVLASIMVRVGFLFAAIAVPSLFVTIVKRMIGRARPMVTGHVDPFAFSPFIWRADYAGLPSGHSTTAFAVLVAFGTLWPRARTAVLIYALLIAASRVVVTAHYPTDVLAGAVVGTVGALMVRRWFALRLLGFSIGPDGVPHQYPGPSLKRVKAVARDLLAP